MAEVQHLAEAVEGFSLSSDHGWFTPFTVAVAGLAASQAAAVPAERFNSVWALVNHVRFWQEATVVMLHGKPIDWQNAQNGWPAPGDPNDEQAWQSACTQALVANQSLTSFIKGLKDEELDQPLEPEGVKRYQIIQGLIGHNSYHICEIISVRHMLGLWLEIT
jgi:hypothetical protein